MHILVASVSAASSPGGVCRHAANLALGMTALPSVSQVTMFIGDWQAGYFREAFDLRSDKLQIARVSISNRALARNLWYLRSLPAAANACGADVVHLAYPMPLVRSAFAAPIVLSLHDLYPFDIPENFKKGAWLNRAALRICLHTVDAIACVSEATQTRLKEIFPATISAKAVVVPNSISLARENCFSPLPHEIRDCPFLLCVAQHRANKNLPLLLRSMRIALDRTIISPRTKLVMVGNEGPETPLLHRMIAEYDLSDHIFFMRGISDSLLSSLYRGCDVVLAPSLLEGFGLPVAEAFAAGSRIVCSDIPAFRAIAAAYCHFFDPTDDSGKSLVTALRKALRSPRGTSPAPPGIDARQAAAMYFDLYRKLLPSIQTRQSRPSVVDLSTSRPLAAPISSMGASERHLS